MSVCVSVFTCLQILIRFTDLVAFKCACSFDIQLINLNVLTYYLTQASVFNALRNAFTLQLLHILYVIYYIVCKVIFRIIRYWTCYSLSTHSAFIAKIVEEIYWNRHESWRLFSVFLEWVLSECTQVEFVFIVVHTRTHTPASTTGCHSLVCSLFVDTEAATLHDLRLFWGSAWAHDALCVALRACVCVCVWLEMCCKFLPLREWSP